MTRRLMQAAVATVVALGVLAPAEAQYSRFGNRGPIWGPNGRPASAMGHSASTQRVEYQNRYSSGTSVNWNRGGGMFNPARSSAFGANSAAWRYRDSVATGQYQRFGGLPTRGIQAYSSGDNNVSSLFDVRPSSAQGLPYGIPAQLNAFAPPVEYAPPGLSFQEPLPPDAEVIPQPLLESLNDTESLTDADAPPAETADAASPAPPRRRPYGWDPGEQRGAASAAVKGTTRKLSNRPELSQVRLSVIDGVWTLRGSVPSEETRRLASVLATLEPGVNQVRNELQVID